MTARFTMDDLLPKIGEQLMHLAMGALLGDSTIRAWGRHGRRDIYLKDSAGRSKADTYRDVLVRNVEWFDDLVDRIRRDPFELAKSLRTEIEQVGKDPRPIEDPAEQKRVLLLFVLSVVQEHLEGLLYEGQLGGRPARYAIPWCPRHGATVLDHAAWRTWNLIRDGGRYVLLVDLEKAYTYLPRDAVLASLRRAGFEERAARWIWRLVQLDSLDRKTRRPIKSAWYRGEEQGNSLSTMILNLVVSKVLKRIEGRLGIPSVAYVDDLYFFAESQEQAEACLEVLHQMFKSEGIMLRKLGQPKGPEIIDTDKDPVLLLKTYRVDAAGIEFTFGKVLDTWTRAQKMGLRGKTIGRRRFLEIANNQAVIKGFFTGNPLRRIPRGDHQGRPQVEHGPLLRGGVDHLRQVRPRGESHEEGHQQGNHREHG